MWQPIYSRAFVKHVGVVGVCILSPLCLWPSHATGQAAAVHGGRARLSGTASALVRTVRVGQHPALVAIDAHDRRVFVANEGPLAGDFVLPSRSDSVSMVDERTGAVLRTVTVGQTPVAIAFDAPTGRVFVLAAGRIDTSVGFTSVGGSVSVLNAVTGAVLRTLEVGSVPLTALGAGTAPSARQALAVDATSGRVYVAAAATILALDGSTGTIRQTIELSMGGPPQIPSPSTIAVSAQAKRLYVGDGYDAAIPPSATRLGEISGSLAVLDSATTRGVANVVLAQQGIGAIAIDARAGRVLVIKPHGVSERAFVDVFAARTGARLRTITLPGAFGAGNCAVALDGARGRAFVLYTPERL